MEEEIDDNNEELKPRVSEDLKVVSSAVPSTIGLPDVTLLQNDPDSSSGKIQKNDENVDARQLDSVYQYASKIRQFIGLAEPEEDKLKSGSSPEIETANDKLDDQSNPNLEKNDVYDENLTDLDQNKNNPDSPIENVSIPTSKNSLDTEDNSEVKQPLLSLSEGINLPPNLHNEPKEKSISKNTDEQAQCENKNTEKPIERADNSENEQQISKEKTETIKIHDSSVDLNSLESIIKDEESISRNADNELKSDQNDLTPKIQEQSVIMNENEPAKIHDETITNGSDQNISSIEDKTLVEDNLSNELYAISEEQDSCITTDEIERTPHIENIRRLSVEIVNKVLDTAETQLKDILNEKRKSNADANNFIERPPEVESASFSNAELVNVSNMEPLNFSHEDAKNNLPMNEGSISHLSEQPQVKHKLNNEIQLKEVLAKTYDANDFQKKIEVEMNKFDPKYDIDPDIVCGIGCFKPRWIQPWATSRVYLILYSIIGILSGSYYSYLIGSMSTLEKRFAFKSKTSGIVMTLDEITPLLLGIFVGYFGGKSHRPRMVGFGMLLSSICCFISALPYFIYGPATHLSLGYSKTDNEKKLELCNVEPREEFCEDDDRLPTITPLLLLMLGSFLKGFGNLAYYAIGLAYMDDNAKKKNTPMYFATAFSLRMLGPMVGFLMCSFFLKFYENPFVDPGFDTTDPRWIGCWWGGFLVQGVLLLIFTVPISLFPRRLPGTVDHTKSQEQQQSAATSFVGLFAALKRLAKNPVYCLINLNVIMGIFGSYGHYIMLPRYMENQFRVSASTSNLISGPPGIGSLMISMTVGGYLIWKFKPGAKFLSAALCAAELLQFSSFLILMIPRCARVEMTNYGFNSDGLVLQNECNSDCNCTTSAFSPVCGPDGASQFFSPCHAGCSEKVNGSFWNCSCVFDSSGQRRDYVTDGFCVTEDCWPSILAYILTVPAVTLVVHLCRVGHTMIFLRSIKPADKSVALGTFETLICLFGFIPYPVMYGALVDSTCLIWEKSCGETGNCWYYDVSKLNYLLHGTSATFTLLEAGSLLGVFFLASRVPDLYKEDFETEDNIIADEKEAEPQGEIEDTDSVTKL